MAKVLRGWLAAIGVLARVTSTCAQGAETAPEGTGPRLILRGFADVSFVAVRNSEPTTTSFALGQFDLFMVSHLTDQISVLGETVFELNAEQEAVVDVERLQIRYAWSDAFRLTVGRTHTGLGYWNEAYHHGAILQPTVERPEALKFEDDGGILPVHSVGFEASGRVGAAWSVAYTANLANGRGPRPDFIQGAADLNRDKAVALKLSLSHEGARRLQVGPMIYRDRIPADPGVPGREAEIDETIPGAHLVYRDSRLELLSEYFRVTHDDRGSGSSYRHTAWYAIGTLTFGAWRPYAGVDTIDFTPGDPFYGAEAEDLTRYLVGLRYEFSTFNAVKGELRREERSGVVSHVVAVQSAFTF